MLAGLQHLRKPASPSASHERVQTSVWDLVETDGLTSVTASGVASKKEQRRLGFASSRPSGSRPRGCPLSSPAEVASHPLTAPQRLRSGDQPQGLARRRTEVPGGPGSHPSGGGGRDRTRVSTAAPRPGSTPHPQDGPSHRPVLANAAPTIWIEPAWVLARAGWLRRAERAEGSHRGEAPSASGRRGAPAWQSGRLSSRRQRWAMRTTCGRPRFARPRESRPDKSDAWGWRATGGPRGLCGRGRDCPRATAPQSPNSYCVPKSGGNRRSTATPPRQEPPVAGGRVDGAACEKHGWALCGRRGSRGQTHTLRP